MIHKGMIHIRRKGFCILTVLLILATVFCIKGTVMSRESDNCDRQNRYYAALEQEYLDQARLLLKEEGFRDCGVNIRWVAEGDGKREYTVLLHHRKLDRMSEEERESLTDKLSDAEFEDGLCCFYYIIG